MRLPLSSHLHRLRRPPRISSTNPPHLSGSPPPSHSSHSRTDDLGADGSRPNSPSIGDNRASSVDTSRQSVLQLFKEDYASCRIYMKDIDYREALRKALRRHMYKWYAILVIAIILTALLTAKHESVVKFCEPVTRTIRAWPGGWLIPLAILIVVSFPPLVGHEIVGILCGLVYGLWIGFAILAAGTFLGEIATWIAFKWFCQGRAQKFEKKNKLYASLTQLIREKSFMFTLILRFSAVPGHITTAVSASAGANFWMYLAAAFLTLPKQFTIVYLGKAFGTQSRKNTIISIITTVLTLIGTVIAALYIYYQMRIVMKRNTALVLPTVIEPDLSMTMSEFVDEKAGSSNLHARRPWLFTRGSTMDIDEGGSGFRTPTRSWSMPGHMNEDELREWVKEMEYEQSTNAGLSFNNERSGKTPAIRIDDHGSTSGIFDNLPPVFTPALEVPPGFSSNSLSPSPAPSGRNTPYLVDSDNLTASNATNHDLPPTYPPTPPKRGESSTPKPASFETPRGRGGREIADEADAYAVSKGARRPDYGRMRGDSRAALLGRPVDDGALELGGGSWRRDYTRSRGDSGATSSGRPTSEDLGDAIVNWKRDYGRSRGESGAALLGRPSSADLTTVSGLNRVSILENREKQSEDQLVEELKE
ncbi:uncharacterized protein IL334_001179 [Kwoniella shivajii]|uniref:Golgi apparatus membrane protein TVP38 n=1 Tax=Kwoniella shivajii TaxID=564305 RepID=A0ABZ1CRD2_9TREE|nr:hypothetical protein IL334_001179 [Kwoniella shivajii]